MDMQTLITILIGIVVAAVNTYIGVKIKARDADTRKYREERERNEKERLDSEKKVRKLSEESTLALIRVELRDNYLDCKRKGYYSMQDREVFHPLFNIYKGLDGDGIVDQWRDELVQMPTEETTGHKIKRFFFRRRYY